MTEGRTIGVLQQQLEVALAELDEARAQQTAMSEVLRAINVSAGDLTPVSDLLVDKAVEQCAATGGELVTFEGDLATAVSLRNVRPALVEFWRMPQRIAGTYLELVRRNGKTLQHPDMREVEDYKRRLPLAVAGVELGGIRTFLQVPLKSDRGVIGLLMIFRYDVQPFTDRQVALLEAFAAQAVIAVENARLVSEQREALEQQTATAEILRVISQSPSNVQPVLEAVASAAVRLCGAADVSIALRDGAEMYYAIHVGPFPATVERTVLDPGRASGRAILEGRTIHLHDIKSLDPVEFAGARRLSDEVGFQSSIAAPMMREGAAVGCILLRKPEPTPFTARQIELLETFAAQAVIAIENVRLFTELKESLEQQTATADILRVISQSPTDVQPVLRAVATAALRFCGANDVQIALREGDKWFAAAHLGPIGSLLDSRRPLTRETAPGRAMLDGKTVHLADIGALNPVEFGEARRLGEQLGFKSALCAPMLRDGVAIGSVSLRRPAAGAFTERQIALAEAFAAQAVIAIENVRLFTELRDSLDQQTATSDILRVISQSPTDVQPVLEAVVKAARRFCGAEDAVVLLREGDQWLFASHEGPMAAEVGARQGLSRQTAPGQAMLDGVTVHFPEIAALDPVEFASAHEFAKRHGFQAALAAPMLREGVPIGAIALRRSTAGAFTPRQIELLESFAAQAVIALENTRLFTELKESLDRQTATAEVLETINRAQGNLQPVFDAIIAKAMELCGAAFGTFSTYDGHRLNTVATQGVPEAFAQYRLSNPPDYGPGTGPARLIAGEDYVHDIDAADSDSYRQGDRNRRAIVDLGGARTILNVALRKDRTLLGTISIYRQEVRPFSDGQIAMLQGFAAQAVIAMENARLLGELTRREEELRVTFDHMGDGVVMFDAGLKLASWNRNFQELLDIPDSFIATRPGLEDYVRLLVQRGELGHDNPDEAISRYRERASEAWTAERTRPDGRIVEVRNNPVPGGGSVLIYSDITERKRAEAEIAAARDAAEAALERQSATADILGIIASSLTNVQPVLDAVVKAAVRFCGATDALINVREGNEMVRMAHEGPLTATIGRRRPIARDSASARSIHDGQTVHHPDIEALDPDEFATGRQQAAQNGYRAALAAPMLREGTAIGNIVLRKAEAGPFTTQQITLLETFAAQAVIAIENVRLFTELRSSLDQQTATADILKVIASSPTDVLPVLDAVVKAAVRFCGAPDAIVSMREGDEWVPIAHHGTLTATLNFRQRLSRESTTGRAIIDGKTIHVADITLEDPQEYRETMTLARQHKWRAALVAPMLRDGLAIGSIMLRKPDPGSFAPQQIALLETFAAQAVIAIENVRLFTELRDSLERLKAAQANLVQSEKMASLGQLTAGIAHEIKNPLNFVNNFAMLSVDLLDELKEVAGPALATLDEDKRTELDETMELLTGNLGKIAEHGKRADGIVKSMLSHSRGGTGDWAPSDINALIEEALNLAYHGARAQDKEFNVTLERDLEKAGKPIEVVPQDVTRVFLNLFGNGFYAANKRRLANKDAGFRPTLRVTTRETGDGVEVRVRDNGTGIPPEVREKLFQPFFTTKPTGEGTGLGLSISYDIVTQQHGGTIEVESEPGVFTEFTVRLPRVRRVAEARGAE